MAASTTFLLLALALVLGLAAGGVVALRFSRRTPHSDDSAAQLLRARADDQAVIRAGLDDLAERLTDLEHQRVSWQSQLRQQVDEVRHSTDSLRRETGSLATALRRPHVRGQWGELHLRRAVELAGLVDRCDFTEQHSIEVDGRQLRPDLVVHLPGERHVVIDAKTPLDAYLDALAIDADLDPEGQRELLQRHAAQMRRHVHDLSSKAYWSALPGAVDFVVLFVPSESCLAAALDTAPSLLEEAARRQVVLASPTTLIALLRTIAHSWTSQSLAEATREIHELGRELHGRLATMGSHLDRLGRSLKASVDAYNATIGSLETRVLVTARQFNDIGVGREPLPAPNPVDLTPRPQTAAELLEELTPQRPEIGPETAHPEPRRGNHDSAHGGSTLGA